MDEKSVTKALTELRKIVKKRKFSQTIDLIVAFKDIDMAKVPKLEQYVALPSGLGKDTKICALVGNESEEGAKSADRVILSSDFDKFKEKREIKKLAREYDYFVAQADMMPRVAQSFGRYFGPVNRMPNPKAGCVVPPRSNISNLVGRLRNTVHLVANKIPMFQVPVGIETQNDAELTKNILAVMNSVENVLPNGRNNIGKIYIKSTMSKAVKV
jgi:large subunit ribosomal protein L1